MSQLGKTGTQSGRADEGSTATLERILQSLFGYGAGAGGTIASAEGLPVVGVPVIGAGAAAITNAKEYNPQDVWLHQLLQEKRRGRDARGAGIQLPRDFGK